MVDISAEPGFPSLGDRYVIEAFLGEGSHGRVYRAVDRQLGRTVAVKVLRSRDPDEIGRLQTEARSQAGIDHENICRVFDVADVDGRGFITMQFIDGPTLWEIAGELDLDEKLELLEQVARAVQAAHDGGVMHGDLEPGNIMVERRPDGGLHALVLDFGIDGLSQNDDSASAGFASGMPAYKAPEQITTGRRALDRRADVYGLGATLYGVTAEQAPFFGATRAEVRSRVVEDEPIRIGLVVPGTPDDIETIVGVAMAKDPDRRYPSARAFADDLRRWRSGQPILTRFAGPLYRLSTWLRTRRTEVALLAILVVSLGLAVATALWLRQKAAQRQALVAQYQNEVEQIDRLLRRARMMPLHDTTAAEEAAKRRLNRVEGTLLAHGPLARGPAYYALGFGHLMLRDFEEAESWLGAAMDSGFTDPEVESALGIAQAMRRLESGGGEWRENQVSAEEIMRHLAASGPKTAGRDLFHRSLGLFVEDRLDDALETARESTRRTPWLYEAAQLEGEILIARAERRRSGGDPNGALSDLDRAGRAFGRGLEVARSDAWLYELEAERLLRVIELLDPGDPMTGSLLADAERAAASALRARPDLVGAQDVAERIQSMGGRFDAGFSESRSTGDG